MVNKRVTLSFDPKIYSAYKKYCKKKGLIISRQFEIVMERQIEKEGFKNDI